MSLLGVLVKRGGNGKVRRTLGRDCRMTGIGVSLTRDRGWYAGDEPA